MRAVHALPLPFFVLTRENVREEREREREERRAKSVFAVAARDANQFHMRIFHERE